MYISFSARIFLVLVFFGFHFISCNNSSSIESTEDLTKFVNPFMGSGGEIGEGHGNVYPGAAFPFGMIQLSPDNGGEGWEYCSGYHYPDSMIAGFSHTHLSGTGVGDLADISVMPTQKEIKAEYFNQTDDFISNWRDQYDIPTEAEIKGNYLLRYRSGFSHENENASPGYYSVLLDDDNILAELAVTELVGWHRYTYNEKDKVQHLILDLGFHINRDSPTKTKINVVSDRLITGYRFSTGWAKDQKVFFAMQFSKPFDKRQFFVAEKEIGGTIAEGEKLKGVFSFIPESGDSLLIKTAISSASIEGALANLKTSHEYNWNFDAVRNATSTKWNDELNKVQVKTANTKSKTIFYTSMYRSFLTPHRFSDVDGFYKGFNGELVKAAHTQYTVLSLWDTFRGLKPLLTMLQPEVYENIIHSMLAQYQQNGLLPYWEIVGNEGGSMIGYHAVPVIADAIFKDIGDFDKQLAYEAMKTSSLHDRKGLGYYREYGFVPTDLDDHGTVSKTIEFAYDDWCIAQAAKYLNDTDSYNFYMKSASNYKNVFDTELKMMRGKKSDGDWLEGFHPRFAQYGNPHFVEGNSWHYTFFAPHDVEGLIDLMGGDKDFEMMLDSLFTQSSELLGEDTEDVTGMIGQYAHGNEPSHHVPYLYNYIGKNHKTQYMVNLVLESMYDNTPDGLCGNEDCGQISSWYVWSSLGFYPVNPISGEYQIGSPQFEEASIQLPGGKTFKLVAHNVSEKNIYIKNIKLNNKSWKNSFIRHADIMDGGIMEFEMTSEPIDFSENK
jgi:predicted alpha-1,2-mannosidase